MDPRTLYEREEDLLAEQLNGGLITNKEYNERMRDLQRDYRGEMEEAMRQAAEAERERW